MGFTATIPGEPRRFSLISFGLHAAPPLSLDGVEAALERLTTRLRTDAVSQAVDRASLIEKLDAIVTRLTAIAGQGDKVLLDLSGLTSSVATMTTVDNSITQLLGNISQELKDALAQPTPQETIDQVAALQKQIDANNAAISAAVTANTPAAQPPAA